MTNNGVITIDGSAALTLNDATIAGGTLIDNGTDRCHRLQHDQQCESQYRQRHDRERSRLTLDGDTVTGTGFTNAGSGSAIDVDGGDTLSLSGVTVSGGGFTIAAAHWSRPVATSR